MHTAGLFVGINYPWVTCGHDFGPRPPAWASGGREKRSWSTVENELRAWRNSCGLSVVRFWVLAGGVNYPAGEDPRERFDIAPLPPASGLHGRLQHLGEHRRLLVGNAKLPMLPNDFLEDFEGLLMACRKADVQLIPSLLSFEFFHPIDVQTGGVLSNGRASLVFGDDGRQRAQVDRFLDATLSPLLDVSRRHRQAIYAWELVNEPDWAVVGGPVHARVRRRRLQLMPKLVSARSMESLLRMGLRRILEAGFRATIGFKQADPTWLSAEFRRSLISSGSRGDYLHQLHYYPSLYEPFRLRQHASLPIQPCMIGEMPTKQARPFGIFSMAWLDDFPAGFSQELDAENYLKRRLQRIESARFIRVHSCGARIAKMK